jgi:hypothetical protein
MSAARPVAPSDSPEVAAFRKRMRGEPLTDAERELLADATRKLPTGTVTVPHSVVMAELADRERLGK